MASRGAFRLIRPGDFYGYKEAESDTPGAGKRKASKKASKTAFGDSDDDESYLPLHAAFLKFPRNGNGEINVNDLPAALRSAGIRYHGDGAGTP